MTDVHMQHEFQHAVLEAFSKAVPGFRYAFTHSAEFHAAMLGEINLMLMRTELMTIGSQTKAARMHEEIDRLNRAGPGSMYFERVTQQRVLNEEDAKKIMDMLNKEHKR